VWECPEKKKEATTSSDYALTLLSVGMPRLGEKCGMEAYVWPHIKRQSRVIDHQPHILPRAWE
jgi:hypothetical protein